jgi:hypothetical protein
LKGQCARLNAADYSIPRDIGGPRGASGADAFCARIVGYDGFGEAIFSGRFQHVGDFGNRGCSRDFLKMETLGWGEEAFNIDYKRRS